MICTRQKEPRYDEHFSSMRKTEKRSSSNLYHLMNNSGSCVNLEHIEMEPWIPSPSQIPIHTSGSFSSESEFSMARFKGSQVVVEVSATKPKAQIGLTSLAQKSEIPSSHYEAKISNVSKDISKRESLKEGTHLESFQSTVVHRSPSAPTLLKQNSQNSVYQQLKAMTPVSEWRSLPGSRLNLEPESVSLATRDSCDRVLPHVESTGMKAEKEQRYSHTCLEHTEMESQPLSLMPQQRSQSLVSLPDKCLLSARVNSAPSSTYGMQLSEMESEPPFPSLKGRPRTRILPNDGYAPVQAELAPSSLKGAQASCSVDSQSKSASLSTEELSTSLRTQTAENGEGYSQVSLRLSELDAESLSPSPKKRSDDSRSLTDFEGRVDQGDTPVVASYPRNVVESQTPVYPEVSRDLRTVTFKSLPALQPPDTTFEKSKEQPIKPTTGQTSGVKTSPCIVGEKCLADGVRKNLSSLEDISEGACHKEILSTERTGTPVLVSSSDKSFKSLSNEDVPLHRYNTALVGSSSFQIMSQFSRSRSPDKESNSSLEDNDVSSASKGNLREGELFPTLETREATLVSGLDELESPSSCKDERFEPSLHLFEDRSLPERAKSVPNLLKRSQKGSLVDLITKSSLLLRAEGSQTLSSQVNPVVPRAVMEQSCSQAALEHRELGSESRATFSKKRSNSLSSFEDQLSSEGVKSARTVSDRSQETSRSSIELELHKLEAESPGTFSNQISDSLYLLKGQPPPERVKSTPTPSESTRETSGLNSLKRSGPLLTKEFSENLLSQVRSAKVLTEIGHSYSQSSLGLDGLESESLSSFTKQTSQSSSSSLYDQQSQTRPKSASSSLRKPEIDSVGSALQSALCLAKKKSQNLLPHPEPEASTLVKGRKSSECGEDLGESSSPSSKDGSDSLSSVEHRLLSEKEKASPQSLTGSLAQAGLTSLSILAQSLTMVPSERLLPRSQPARTPTEGEQYSQERLVLGKVECELLSSEKQVSKLSQPSIEGRLSPAGVKAATSSLTETQLNVYDEGPVAETFIIPSESSELIGGRFEDKEPVSRSTSILLSSKVMPGGVQSDTLSRAESLKKAPVGTSSQFRPSTSHLKDETRSPSCFEGSMDQDDVSVAASYKKELVESQNLVFPEVGRGLTITTSKSLKELQPLDTTFENSSEQPIKQTTGQQMKLESKSPSSSKEERSESLYLFDDRLLLEGATSVPNLLKGYQKGSYIELRSKSAPLLTAEISQSLSSQVEPVGARAGGEQCFSHAGRELGSESRATFSKKRTDSSPLLEDRLPPERVKSTPTLSERSQETSTLNSPSNSASLLTEEFSQSLCSQKWPAKVIAERGQSYSHGSLGQDGFESESLSQLTMQRSQSSSFSLHDQRAQAAPSSLRKLGISVSVDSALESSPCLAERQPPNLLPDYARETPSQMMGVRDDQNYEELPARDNSATAVNSPSLDDSFTSSSNEDVPISSYESALSGPSSFHIPHQFFHIETSDKESTSSFKDHEFSSASEGDLRDNESCTILKTHENIHVETFPEVLKSAERLIYLKTVDSHQTVMLPAFTVEQTEELSKLPLAETPRPSLSAPQRDDSERLPLRSSAEDSSSNEDVTLRSYTTVLLGSTSVRVPSQFFQIESSDKESSSSLENNEFSSSGEDNLRDNESCPMLETLEKLHVESSHEVLKVAGRLDHHKTLDSYQTHVLPTLTVEQTEDLSRLTVADSARPSFSVPRKNDPEKALFSSSSDNSFTSSSSEDVPIQSYRTALNDPLWFQIPSKFFQIESSDEESSCSFEDNERLSASEGNLHDNDKESRSYLEGTAFSPADEDDSPHKESFPKRYIQKNVQNEMVIPVMKTDDRPLLPVAIMDASVVEEPGLASPKESQFAAGSSSHSFLDVDFLQQSKEADLLTEIYGVEKRDRTLTEVPSVLPSDLSSRTVSKVPPQRSRISKVGRKFKKIFEIGKSKNRHKELQKLEPEGDSSDFDGKTKEPPTSSHQGIGHPTSHSSVSTLRDNWPFLAVAVETTESSILHSKGIAPSGQDSISSDVASSSANLYASAVETERPAPVQSSIPRDRGILTTDDAAITQRVNEMISTIVKNARAALEYKLKDEISEPPCSLSDAVINQRINEMINTIVNNARAALKYKLKDAEMSLCEQSMKSSSESSLLATEPFQSPNAKDRLSIITEISQGNLECTLQDISRRPSSETSFFPFLVENRETAGQEPPCSLLDAATTQRMQ